MEFATSKLFRSLWLKCNENSKQLPLAKVTCINSRLELKFAQFKSILPLIIITPMHTCIAPEDINGQSPPNSPSYRHHHKPICYFILHDKSSKRLGGGLWKHLQMTPFFWTHKFVTNKGRGLMINPTPWARKIIVLVKSFHENLGEDLGSWTHSNSTLTRKSLWPTLIIFMLTFHSH